MGKVTLYTSLRLVDLQPFTNFLCDMDLQTTVLERHTNVIALKNHHDNSQQLILVNSTYPISELNEFGEFSIVAT